MRLASDFLSYCLTARGFTEATAKTYAAAITDFERSIGKDDPATVTVSDLDDYMTKKTVEGRAISTRRARAHALKSFFRFLKSRDLIPTNPALEFFPPDEQTAAISALTEAEVQAMIFLPEPAPPERRPNEPFDFYDRRTRATRLCFLRDSALIGLMFSVGLRAGEIKTLRRDALIQTPQGERFVMLKGKRAREPRPFLIDRKIAVLLDAYLAAMNDAGLLHPALFRATSSAPKTDAGLGEPAVCRIVEQRATKAGINPKGRKITPHIFRYSICTILNSRGLKLDELRDFMRHKSVETTMRYIAFGNARASQRRAAARLPWNVVGKLGMPAS